MKQPNEQKDLGISLRLIRAYDIKADVRPPPAIGTQELREILRQIAFILAAPAENDTEGDKALRLMLSEWSQKITSTVLRYEF